MANTQATRRALTRSRQRGSATQKQFQGKWLERRLRRLKLVSAMRPRLTLEELRAQARAVCYGAEL